MEIAGDRVAVKPGDNIFTPNEVPPWDRKHLRRQTSEGISNRNDTSLNRLDGSKASPLRRQSKKFDISGSVRNFVFVSHALAASRVYSIRNECFDP